MQRLDKLLSHRTGLSRKQSQQEIRGGQVRIEGETIKDVRAKFDDQTPLTWNGDIYSPLTALYFMLHKPQDYVCSTDDPHHASVLELISEQHRSNAKAFSGSPLHCAGRLDMDTTGLVLLSNDGAWTHNVTSPKKQCEKRYRVWLDREINPSLIETFADGLMLKSEETKTRPAELTIIDDRVALLTITEGRYHQVKRMFAACGYHVERLHREAIGGITLDESLTGGDYRHLNNCEVELFS